MTSAEDPTVDEPPPGVPSLVDATAGRAAAAVFGAASLLRRRRSLHPDGVACEAVVRVDPHEAVGARLLDEPGEHRAVVRLSRAVGLPERAPDILGIAVRIADGSADAGAGQDLLFSTVVGDGRVGRHVLSPTRSFVGRPFSTILPYAAAGARLTLLARGRGAAPAAVRTLQAAGRAFEAGELSFRIEAAVAGRRPVVVGAVTGVRRLPADEAEPLRFNPYHATEDLQPTGTLNALRRRAYAASQRARRAGPARSGRAGAPSTWAIELDVRDDAPSVFVPVGLAPDAAPGDVVEVTSTLSAATRRGSVVERVDDPARGEFLIVSLESP